eukprot:6202506-Pleurochrysis_carterae.AAC.4
MAIMSTRVITKLIQFSSRECALASACVAAAAAAAVAAAAAAAATHRALAEARDGVMHSSSGPSSFGTHSKIHHS